MPPGKKIVFSPDPTALTAMHLPCREVLARGLKRAGFYIRPGEDTFYEQNWDYDTLMVWFQTGEHANVALHALHGFKIGGEYLSVHKSRPQYQTRSADDAVVKLNIPGEKDIQEGLVAAYEAYLRGERSEDDEGGEEGESDKVAETDSDVKIPPKVLMEHRGYRYNISPREFFAYMRHNWNGEKARQLRVDWAQESPRTKVFPIPNFEENLRFWPKEKGQFPCVIFKQPWKYEKKNADLDIGPYQTSATGGEPFAPTVFLPRVTVLHVAAGNRSVLKMAGNGMDTSHLCHNPWCVRTNHVIYESRHNNGRRNMCATDRQCKCGLDPQCLVHLTIPKNERERLFEEDILKDPHKRK